MDKGKSIIVAAVIAAVGLLLMGLCLKAGIDNFVNKDRVVTVKGLAEMQVDADKVTWPIVTRETGNDIQSLYNTVNRKNESVIAFLKQNGLTDAEININPVEVDDRSMNEYANERITYRYRAKSVITVISDKVDKVREIIAKQGELLERGIVIDGGEFGSGIYYEYSSFASIKGQMMEQAIANAQKTAEQFASASGSDLGKIITADQGQFSIDDLDSNTPYKKSLRVVTTITYRLSD